MSYTKFIMVYLILLTSTLLFSGPKANRVALIKAVKRHELIKELKAEEDKFIAYWCKVKGDEYCSFEEAKLTLLENIIMGKL